SETDKGRYLQHIAHGSLSSDKIIQLAPTPAEQRKNSTDNQQTQVLFKLSEGMEIILVYRIADKKTIEPHIKSAKVLDLLGCFTLSSSTRALITTGVHSNNSSPCPTRAIMLICVVLSTKL